MANDKCSEVEKHLWNLDKVSLSSCSQTVTDDLLSNFKYLCWHLKFWVEWEIWNLFWNCFPDCLYFRVLALVSFPVLYPSTVANYPVYQIMLQFCWNRELNKMSWKMRLNVCAECHPVCGFVRPSPQRLHKWECESTEGINLICILIKRVKLKKMMLERFMIYVVR